jgi:hypothetical protein
MTINIYLTPYIPSDQLLAEVKTYAPYLFLSEKGRISDEEAKEMIAIDARTAVIYILRQGEDLFSSKFSDLLADLLAENLHLNSKITYKLTAEVMNRVLVDQDAINDLIKVLPRPPVSSRPPSRWEDEYCGTNSVSEMREEFKRRFQDNIKLSKDDIEQN